MTTVAIIVAVALGSFAWGYIAGQNWGARLKSEISNLIDKIDGKVGRH